MTTRLARLIFLLGLLPLSCMGQPTTSKTSPTLPPADNSTLDYDIGNMLLVGFRGTKVDDQHHIVRDIVDYHVGSVILFDYDSPGSRRGRNIVSSAQLKRLCSRLHSLNPTLLIGVDQEGGRVNRLKATYGFPTFLSAKSSAAMGLDSVRANARRTASALAQMGINLNFAPVADVDINPDCPVIGRIERSFSANPQQVAACCKVWIDEQHDYQVISCLKHFPGHGSAKGDTHQGLVDVTTTWQRTELEPYHTLAHDSLLMVMTAHVVNRQLDTTGLPASLSPRITALLRDSIGFEGVICTDDLAMGAIVQHYSLEQTIALALAAGADLLCLSNNGVDYDPDLVPKVVSIIKQLVAEGKVSSAQLHRSAERVRKLQQATHF